MADAASDEAGSGDSDAIHDELFVSNLVDMLAGGLSTPLSDATRRALGQPRLGRRPGVCSWRTHTSRCAR
jgi:hypothetical protein